MNSGSNWKVRNRGRRYVSTSRAVSENSSPTMLVTTTRSRREKSLLAGSVSQRWAMAELSTPKPKGLAQNGAGSTAEGIEGDQTADAELDKSFVYHEIRAKLAALPSDTVVDEKREQLDRILAGCLGLVVETTVPQAEITKALLI